MAYYQCSKIIRMRRKALGYRQAAFECEKMTGMTLYRVENGKSKGTEQTYRMLTKIMEIEESTRQGVLKTSSMATLHLVNDIMVAFRKSDYAKVAEMLAKIEGSVDADVPRNRQYIAWIKAKLQYEQKLLSPEEYESEIRKALTYTIPKFGKISMKKWPFHQMEMCILTALSRVLRAQKKYAEQKELVEGILELLSADYIDLENKTRYRICMMQHLADILGNMGEHEAAIELDKESIRICEEHREFRALHNIYYDLHWNYYELRKKKALSMREEAECRQSLLKAYYLSEAQGNHRELYEQRLRERYPEELS